MAAKKSTIAAPDELDAFVRLAEGSPHRALMLAFWKDRHDNPSFTIEVDANDIKGFNDCVKYLEVTPAIRVYRPQGLPAQEAIPATAKRRAVPGRAAQPPKDYVVVQMVDQDGNCFVPVENNERDFDKGEKSKAIRRLRESAPQIAAQLQADLQSNTMSNATIQEAIDALKVLAQAR